jgi:hypothetical protein
VPKERELFPTVHRPRSGGDPAAIIASAYIIDPASKTRTSMTVVGLGPIETAGDVLTASGLVLGIAEAIRRDSDG